jgi:hypothetical protein
VTGSSGGFSGKDPKINWLPLCSNGTGRPLAKKRADSAQAAELHVWKVWGESCGLKRGYVKFTTSRHAAELVERSFVIMG